LTDAGARLGEDRFYQAMLEQDGRFDGLFFSGIVTTGVYCRAVCPVPRIANRENVRFYTSIAAAEDAGFRPCLRCHPERSAGTPVWGPFPPVVSRALGLIFDGALEEGDVESLARRLGLGSRQLRRLFNEHLGASPLAVAKARRVHFASCLLQETKLSISDVAFASGFRSIRQFNHDFLTTFGRSPTEIRHRPEAASGGSITISLPYRPPLDWPRMIAFLQPRVMPGVEVVSHDRYRRAIEIDNEPGELEVLVVPDRPVLLLRLHAAGRSRAWLRRLVGQARRMFDLDADPLRIASELGDSDILGPLIEARPGLRVVGAWDRFELAVRAVLGPQISVRAAATLTRRLVHSYGRPVDGAATVTTHLFPAAAALADADLRSIGATRTQEGAIRAVATAVATDELRLDASQGLEEFVERFCRLPGAGPWTAHYVAMRALGEPDAFPAGDLGLRRALADDTRPLSSTALTQLAEKWRPWRSYAAMYLWTKPTTARRSDEQ
jgi:AraC family transcriptional regulator, regulatory protein of adaptative response / DNA-3-methyladenine glycosylase II